MKPMGAYLSRAVASGSLATVKTMEKSSSSWFNAVTESF